MAKQNEFEYFDSVNKFASENQSNKTKQQTAVGWLMDRIKNQHLYGFTPLHELEEQAKAMEKEQIVNADLNATKRTAKGFNADVSVTRVNELAEKYYNETYSNGQKN